MIQEIIATGRDVNAAIDSGCQQLGINREEDIFDFEIIAREKKGFLGLKTYPAKVRVFREVPDPKPVVKQEKPKPAPAPQAAKKPAEKDRPAPEKKPEERPAPVREAKEPKEPKEAEEKPESQPPREPRKEKGSRPPRERKPKEQKEQKPPREPRLPKEQPSSGESQSKRPSQVEVEPTDNVRERIERSAAYVEKILGIMGIGEVKVTPRYYEDNVCLQLTGAGLGVIIGRRGETLDAIQYLSSLVANRGEGDYIRVNIDSGNYREKRERTLEALARKLANNAVRTGKSTTLEPMNPYERRVIHGAVAQVKGATSSSIGVDPNRRVVISATSAPARRYEEGGRGSRRDDRRREGGRGSRRDDRRGHRSSGRDRTEETAEPKLPRPKLDDGPAPERTYTPKPTEPVAPTPKLVEFTQEEREVTEKTSLYGKIEL